MQRTNDSYFGSCLYSYFLIKKHLKYNSMYKIHFLAKYLFYFAWKKNITWENSDI